MTEPDFSDYRGELRVGHVLDKLRELPNDLAQLVVTSPPFYMARSYGTEPQVWGGDPFCLHDWREITTPCGNGSGGGGAKDIRSVVVGGTRKREITSSFCTECAAWKGEHGHEPSVSLWAHHERQVFQEVRRVLRPDGVLVIEGGDTYACQPAGNDEETRNAIYDDRRHRDKPGRGSLPAGNMHLQFERLMLLLQEDGWRVRACVVWEKQSPKPECLHGWRWEPCRVKLEGKARGWTTDTGAFSAKSEGGGSNAAMGNYAKWGPCPGCAKCAQHDGLVLRKSQWRPTYAHSMFYILTGPGNYYSDEVPMRDFSNSPIGHNAWSVQRFKRDFNTGEHTAGFSEAFPAWCIKAFVPAKGVCTQCGAPRVRVIERGVPDLEAQRRCGGDRNGDYNSHVPSGHYLESGAETPGMVKKRVLEGLRPMLTKGWKPTCACNGTFSWSTVLDPFAGSGTTVRVAREMGHYGIGIELNREYAEKAWARITEGRVFGKEEAEYDAAQLALFEQEGVPDVIQLSVG